MQDNKPYLSEKISIDPELVAEAQNEWRLNHRSDFYVLDHPIQKFSHFAETRSYFLRLAEDTYFFSLFPKIREIIEVIGRQVTQQGSWRELGQVSVVELSPVGKITEHCDIGQYHDKFHRHHFVLDSNGCYFCWDNGCVIMRSGECYRINNTISHSMLNNNWPRTHVIFDAY